MELDRKCHIEVMIRGSFTNIKRINITLIRWDLINKILTYLGLIQDILDLMREIHKLDLIILNIYHVHIKMNNEYRMLRKFQGIY